MTRLDLFRGLTREELKLLEALVRPLVFEAGADDRPRGRCRRRLFFIVARGTVTIQLRCGRTAGQRTRPGQPRYRVPACPSARWRCWSAAPLLRNIVADERVVCYGFSVEALYRASSARAHPNLIAAVLGNMMRDLSERLRRANDEIRPMEQ